MLFACGFVAAIDSELKRLKARGDLFIDFVFIFTPTYRSALAHLTPVRLLGRPYPEMPMSIMNLRLQVESRRLDHRIPVSEPGRRLLCLVYIEIGILAGAHAGRNASAKSNRSRRCNGHSAPKTKIPIPHINIVSTLRKRTVQASARKEEWSFGSSAVRQEEQLPGIRSLSQICREWGHAQLRLPGFRRFELWGSV